MKKIKISAVLMAIAAMLVPSGLKADNANEKKSQIVHPEWCRNAVIYEVNLRQGTAGRTINSFAKELPRLKELGVDILWLMPIHPISELNRKGELGSYYAVADYKAFNPEFGTMDDMKNFVQSAHDFGMKVIIDEVCNHTGCDHPWTKSNPEFYVRDKNGNMTSPYDWTDTYKLDYSNKELRKQMIDALCFWVKEVDIDGYRCDVAGEVPTDFWNEAKVELDKIKPIFMLAEASKPELTSFAFNADYNWPMKDLFNAIAATKDANSYAIAKNQKLPTKVATDIDKLLAKQSMQYPKNAINMNMITNHDLNSWEGTEFERYTIGVEAFAVLSYTLPGIPMMYTGQEVGFNHPFEFFKHDITPDYTPNQYTEFYTKLNALKHSQKALDAGVDYNKMTRYLTVSPDIYVFSRKCRDSEVIVFVNLSGQKNNVVFRAKAPYLKGMTDYFSGQPAKLPFELNPWEYKIFVK